MEKMKLQACWVLWGFISYWGQQRWWQSDDALVHLAVMWQSHGVLFVLFFLQQYSLKFPQGICALVQPTYVYASADACERARTHAYAYDEALLSPHL